MQDTATAAGGSNTKAARGETEEKRLPEITKGVRKLPGLVRLFRAQLWLAIIASGLGAIWALFMLLTYGLWRYGPPWPSLFAICLLIGCCILTVRAERAIAERSSEAPGRCRFLVALNIALSLLCPLGLWLFVFFSGLSISFRDILQVLPQILVSVVWSEAWRRYFIFSPNVRAAFQPDEHAPDPAKIMPAELGIFAALCWSAWIWYGFEFFSFLEYFLSNGVSFAQNFDLWPRLGNFLTTLILSPVALWALATRNKNVLLWCLGLFMGTFLILHFAAAVFTAMEFGRFVSSSHSGRLPSILQPRPILALVFWWYLTTSEKAKAYFHAA